MSDAPDKPVVKESRTVKTTVARGRTVRVGGKAYGPGQEVRVTLDDLIHLRRNGFVVERSDSPETPRAGLSIQSEGPTKVIGV